MKATWLWNEKSNVMALVDPWHGGLPLLSICDDEYRGVNPFLTYPLPFLGYYGWVVIGEI